MKILITGVLGTIGKPLWKELRERGYQVYGLDLMQYHDEEYRRCDIGEIRQLEKVIRWTPFDYVYNLAAEFGRWNGEAYYENLWRTNVIGLKNILELQEKYKFKLVHFSSSEVYGDYSGLMSEDVMETTEIKQLNDYAITKWVNEMQILNSAKQKGTESVRVRLFNVYGPGEYYSTYRSALCRFVYRALHEKSFDVYMGHSRGWLYIDDAVNTLANIVSNFKSGEVYNIANENSRTMEGLADLIVKTVGANPFLPDYTTAEPFTTMHKKVSIEKAQRDLNHSPKVDLEEGIKRTIKWQREIYGK